MIREGDKSMEKLKKLMNSYVPEFAYEPGASDPGSVLTDLCAEMIGTCEERYSRVLSKHRIQYLNLFDPLIQEPVRIHRISFTILSPNILPNPESWIFSGKLP